MKTILTLGAGRSSVYFIEFFAKKAQQNECNLLVADQSVERMKNELSAFDKVNWISGNLNDNAFLSQLIEKSDVVISLLPAFMHDNVAALCLEFKKHMATASYVSSTMQSFHEVAKANELVFLNECGLDPGIDHMSACKIIQDLKDKGAIITSFKSYCGGLIAAESIDNPWAYKFTWNPRNVILAGNGTAQFLLEGDIKYVPYQRIFNTLETIKMPNASVFDGYPNRDSLHYKDIYELKDTQTLIRGTLRYPGYCKGWNAIVNLGLTENQTIISHTGNLTYADILNRLSISDKLDLKNKLKSDFPKLIDDEVIQLFDSIGLLSNKECKRTSGTLAEYLQDLLEDAWKLKDNDKDLVVMQHIFEYTLDQKNETLRSSLFVEGESAEKTAMAKTVGLPLAIGVNKIIEGDFSEYGVQIPTVPEWYKSILSQLESFNIRFDESK